MTDARACIAIYHGLYANAAKLWELPSGLSPRTALASHNIQYFRVGKYFVAVLTPNARGNEAAEVVIFEKCVWCVIDGSLRYLTSTIFLY